MNKQQRQELEDMVRQLAEEPYNPSEKHIEEIKQRAFEEYEQIMAAKQKMKEKRKGTLRRVVVTAATIVCLLVGSTVIALLNPLQSGNADNFFRRAVIWVNDQLHLGIEFPKPKDEPEQVVIKEPKSFSSFEEAHKELNIPLVCVTGMDELILDEISAVQEEESICVTIRYKFDGVFINIFMEPSSTFDTASDKINILAEKTSMMEIDFGTVYIWENETGRHALISVQNYQVELSSTISTECFYEICQSLTLVN